MKNLGEENIVYVMMSLVPVSGLLVRTDEGGSREQALKCRPSFIPSLARLPTLKTAVANSTRSKNIPVPTKTRQA